MSSTTATSRATSFRSRVKKAGEIRKNVGNLIRTSMRKNGTGTYLQRVVFLMKQKISRSSISVNEDTVMQRVQALFEEIMQNYDGVQKDDRLTGLLLFLGQKYTLCMLESSEESLGTFMQSLSEYESDDFLLTIRILQVLNNIAETTFKTLMLRNGEPPDLDDSVILEDEASECETIVRRLRELCFSVLSDFDKKKASVASGLSSTSKKSKLLQMSRSNMMSRILPELHVKETLKDITYSDYAYLMPEFPRLDKVIQFDDLLTLDEYCKMFKNVPPDRPEKDEIWPLPYDYCPGAIETTDKYTVNLTFREDVIPKIDLVSQPK